ncbi:MAG: RHS repeat-associated core domain-containing protein [Candidatus Thiodiazotropha sp. 6PLUC1]
MSSILYDSYGHDPVGNITDWQDLLQTARDQSFSYDELDRLTSATGAYGDLGYGYDAVGNRLNKTEDGVSETYNYETGSHRLQEILGSTTDSRLYDEAGNTLSSLIGGYTYDDQNRMVSFTQGGTVASYGYNGKGERVRKTVNGAITRFRYGPSGTLLGEYDPTGEPLREYVYLEGQPIALLSSQSELPVIDFEQNPVLSYGGTGQDINGTEVAQGSSLTLAGNVWKKIAFNYTITPDTILEFDFESGEQGEIHGIGFDTDNGISGGMSFILYGTQNWGIQYTEQYSGNGVMHYSIPVGSYFTGAMDWLTFINDHDVSEPTAESRFSNIRVYEAGDAGEIATGLVYLHTDHLGAVVKATDEAQAVVWDVDRKPFGERESLVAQVEVPLGFPGQYFDQESNNYYNYFRDYDPTTGRYLQSDPIGLGGGINTYSYALQNPINFYDSDGRAPDTGKCGRKLWGYLKNQVKQACKFPLSNGNRLSSCASGESCPLLREKTRRWRQCAVARALLSMTCYPNDNSHYQPTKAAFDNAENCGTILSEECMLCPVL